MVKKPKQLDPYVKRPDPTLTPHEHMRKLDAESTAEAAQSLVSCLPPCYKEPLKAGKTLTITLDRYIVHIEPRYHA